MPPQPCRPTTARPGSAGQPQIYVGLAGRRGYARAGLTCAGGATPGGWRGFVAFGRAPRAAPVTRTFPLGRVRPGDGVFVRVYFSRAAGRARFFVTVPDGAGYHDSASVGVTTFYTQAQALADWARSVPATPARPSASLREARFTSGGFTTASGVRGTFEGPWALSPWEVTSNGQPQPRGRLISAPGYLRADGTQRVLGEWGDVFGVWLCA